MAGNKQSTTLTTTMAGTMATPTFEIWVWQGSASYQGSLTVPSHLKVKDLIDRAIEEVCHESVFLQDSLDP